LLSGPFAFVRRMVMASETFMRSIPEPESKMRIESDLFSGIQ